MEGRASALLRFLVVPGYIVGAAVDGGAAVDTHRFQGATWRLLEMRGDGFIITTSGHAQPRSCQGFAVLSAQ